MGHTEIVELLLDSGAVSDLYRQDDDGDTPMSCAKDEGHPAIVDLLKESAHTGGEYRISYV
jgi:ankyrin repeat protein